MQIEPYLFFEGRCEEALDFYKNALGAETTMLMRFKDSPDQEACPVDDENKIMHAAIKIGDSPIMASDGHCSGNANFQGIYSKKSEAHTTPDSKIHFSTDCTSGNQCLAHT